ncbi:MAG: hypothetical protein K0Q64_998 [Nitrobacter vulgaris]|nr:hypothetical protein [Nitrobacter vulgaris]
MSRVRAYDLASNNNRKEVIQCLIQSAVTSLGSPNRLSSRRGQLSDRASENNIGARCNRRMQSDTSPYQRSWPSQHMMFTLTDLRRQHGRTPRAQIVEPTSPSRVGIVRTASMLTACLMPSSAPAAKLPIAHPQSTRRSSPARFRCGACVAA